MNILSKDELKTLMEKSTGPCVSIFMPTYRTGAKSQNNLIRFKNLLKEVEEQLIANGLRFPEAKELLEPAQELLWDAPFWRQSNGLAMFLSSEVFRYYFLPFEFEEFTVVADHFHIKPLLRLLTGDGLFYILAISQNEVKFFQCTRDFIKTLHLESIPKSLAEALKYDDSEKQLQSHSGGAPAGTAIFHGHAVTDDAKDNILRYFRQIDKGLHGLLREERVPLLLAGVDYLFPIYKEANSYPYLMDEGIKGNPESMSVEKIHEQSWAIIQPYFQKKQKEAVDQYKQLAGTGRTSKEIKEIIPAAYFGRIDLLFVAVDRQQWGIFNPDDNLVYLHQKAEPGARDLLDFAASQTIMNGGTVFVVKLEDMPDDAPLAAVFRY
jgi:hypothetical protein